MDIPELKNQENIQEHKYTIEEFYAVTGDQRAELIDGEIHYLASPVEIHQIIVGEIFTEINLYIRRNRGKCRAFVAPFDVQLSDDIVEPDIFVLCDTSKRSEKRCIGAPDWVIEVTSSNSENDYNKKLNLYKDNGVREYWIINPNNKSVAVYNWESGNDICKVHRFTDTISPGIYKDNPEPLKICVADLIADFNEE